MGKPRNFKLNNNRKKRKNKLLNVKRIIGYTPTEIPIYGSKSIYKYNYMEPSPLEIKETKLNNLKLNEQYIFDSLSPISKINIWNGEQNFNIFLDIEGNGQPASWFDEDDDMENCIKK